MALFLVGRLKRRRVESLSELFEFAKKSIKGGEVLFLPGLNFLFLLELIDYRPKTDSIEYLGPHETL